MYQPSYKLINDVRQRLGWTPNFIKIRELALDGILRAAICGKRVTFNLDHLCEDLTRWQEDEQERIATERAAQRSRSNAMTEYRRKSCERYLASKTTRPLK